jgi:ankyrin repeat protein
MIFSTANIPDKDKAVQALDLLLEKGAEINFLDSNRQTALFYWASKGNTACVKLAIESGALPDL